MITIGRVSAKTGRGPNYKVLKHIVLGSIYNSLDRHLRDMTSPIKYVLTFLSFKIVNIHHKFA
jgi:hypothetical protein